MKDDTEIVCVQVWAFWQGESALLIHLLTTLALCVARVCALTSKINSQIWPNKAFFIHHQQCSSYQPEALCLCSRYHNQKYKSFKKLALMNSDRCWNFSACRNGLSLKDSYWDSVASLHPSPPGQSICGVYIRRQLCLYGGLSVGGRGRDNRGEDGSERTRERTREGEKRTGTSLTWAHERQIEEEQIQKDCKHQKTNYAKIMLFYVFDDLEQ